MYNQCVLILSEIPEENVISLEQRRLVKLLRQQECSLYVQEFRVRKRKGLLEITD